MTILSKADYLPDHFELHNSLKLSFMNIWGLCLHFVDCESFLESNSPDILDLCETNLYGSIDSGNFSERAYICLIWKYTSTHMHGLAVHVKEGLPFARELSLENSAASCLCFGLPLLNSASYFFFLYRSPSLSLCMVFDSISSSIDEVLSINPSANVFVFGDFNVHHKDWLTYSGGTDQPGELCYNFSISNDFTRMVNFPTRIPQTVILIVPLFWIYLFLTLLFVLQWLFLHWEILILVVSQFPLTFHHIHNGMPVSSHRLFSCWLKRSSRWFEKCSMGRYL